MIDLRSDTVTQPSLAMRQAMYEAEVGDDVMGEDPSVISLQKYAAKKFNKPSSLFFPTGTQAGLCALLSHCQRGDEYICGQNAHCYKYEGGGASVLGGVQAQPVENEADGSLSLDKILLAIKPLDIHFVKTKLICLESTFWGQPLFLDYIAKVNNLAKNHKLKLHLDGARVFNAATALKCDVADITDYFDSVTVCLSKGLGAPAGTLLLGDEDFIKEALRWRKVCGGGMRQSGILAAAGLFALKNSPKLLVQDQLKAVKLAKLLSKHKNLKVKAATNMVFICVHENNCALLQEHLAGDGFKTWIKKNTRIVMHQDVPIDSIDKFAYSVDQFFTNLKKGQ